MLYLLGIFFLCKTILAVSILEHARIANGDLCNDSIPYQVSLTISGYHFCGGVVYSENIIITAGHCIHFENFHDNNFAIHAGTNDQTDLSKGQLIVVTKIIRHEKFILHNDTNNNIYPDYDIALLKLKTNLVFNDNVQRIPLATKEPEIGTVGTVSGWGYTLDNRNDASENLLIAHVKLVSRDICQKQANLAEIGNRMLCTTAFDDLPAGACEGDSGGPLVTNNELLDIVSFGNKTCDDYSVYTSIPYMRDWILNEVKNL